MVQSDAREEFSRMIRVEMAMAAYKADKGGYPETLDQLKPQYLSVVPNDSFSETPLKYRKSQTGYLLYSVGVNRKDDGGVTVKSDLGKGDLVVQVP